VLQQISPEYFVLMKPCELVSGDFYWATSFDEYQIFCVADCTGHGVPGAFMSILGLTALNDIVARHRVTKPNEILGYLRESVIEALSQNDPEQLHKDGLDIALCMFNSKTCELQFAGAKIPLWIVCQDESIFNEHKEPLKPFTKNGLSLFEIKGDIMPVGQSPRMLSFTNHSFTLNNSSVNIYLATDGFGDQIGGSKNSKFSSLGLKKIILENIDKPFSDQSELLGKTFDEWKGNLFQVDDVTVLGIKI
jgi:serine phosphatase RsbU (regulator of sigma subunit)